MGVCSFAAVRELNVGLHSTSVFLVWIYWTETLANCYDQSTAQPFWQGIRLMHLCEYHYADVVLTLAYASVYFRGAWLRQVELRMKCGELL